MKRPLSIVLTLLLFFSCQQHNPKPTYSAAQADSLKQAFKAHLLDTEQEFLAADWSPLSEQDKKRFSHLNYYPYDISWRFELPLQRYSNPDSMIVKGSKKGDLRPALKYGWFEFEKDGQKYTLQVIKILPSRPAGKAHLFLGFWDKTSGNETYGGGRYLDIEENEKKLYTLDFNYAYNPYCAYSARYSCAVPPFENRLEIAVTAGEKKFREEH